MPSVFSSLFSSKKFVVTFLTVLVLAALTAAKVITPSDMLHMLTFVVPAYLASQGLADMGKESGGPEPTFISTLEEAERAWQAKNAKVESLTGPATSDMKPDEAPTTKPEEEITKPEVNPFPGATEAKPVKKES